MWNILTYILHGIALTTSVQFFFVLSCLLSLYLPFSLCSSLIGWTTIYPLVHVCSLHHVMCILLAGVLPLWLFSHWFSVTAWSQWEFMLFVVNPYFIHPSGWSNHEHLVWNISSIGCRSDKEIVLWKFTRGPFPSISRNCNLRKAKRRVTQKSTWNPLVAFAFVGSDLISCDPCGGGLLSILCVVELELKTIEFWRMLFLPFSKIVCLYVFLKIM